MYAAVRTYSGQGASDLFDLIEARANDVTSLIGGVPGFVSYVAVRTGDGGVTVTVCEDKAGTDESSRVAAQWVKENSSTTRNPPVLAEGNTVLQFASLERSSRRARSFDEGSRARCAPGPATGFRDRGSR